MEIDFLMQEISEINFCHILGYIMKNSFDGIYKKK